jgi:hypothetical protein
VEVPAASAEPPEDEQPRPTTSSISPPVIHTRTLSSAIDVDATPDRVWSILTAKHDYPQWNPFIRRLDGPLTPGSKLTMRIEPPAASR